MTNPGFTRDSFALNEIDKFCLVVDDICLPIDSDIVTR